MWFTVDLPWLVVVGVAVVVRLGFEVDVCTEVVEVVSTTGFFVENDSEGVVGKVGKVVATVVAVEDVCWLEDVAEIS